MKTLRAILSLYVFAWFTMIVPGHARGAIIMPGTAATTSCCKSHDESDTGKSPSRSERANCAVCYVAAMYSLPPVYVFYVKPLDLVHALNEQRVPQVLSFDFPTPYWPTGPPSAV